MILTEEDKSNLMELYLNKDYSGRDLIDCVEQAILDKLQDKLKNAERYEWLVNNSFDRDGVTQLHITVHSWEPHSLTKLPIQWVHRVRGTAVDRAIDSAMKGGNL